MPRCTKMRLLHRQISPWFANADLGKRRDVDQCCVNPLGWGLKLWHMGCEGDVG